jgi:hypothetical protein
VSALQAEAEELFSNREWRLSNLYSIKDTGGNAIPFRPNEAQLDLLREIHFLNVILKARQLGFTTFIQILMLDACLFNSNISAGVIAHNRDDAEAFFSDKIKFAYEHLDPDIKNVVSATQDSANSLTFSNGSRIRVGTSLRSGTFQYLHVSEFGKICARFPEKAREIVTGAFNAVHAGQFIAVESTAEGQGGQFYSMVKAAQRKRDEQRLLSPLDFKLHFYPWWKDSKYVLPADAAVVTSELTRYFDNLKAKHGIDLTPQQMAWYAAKQDQQGDDMKREFPSTEDEAFEANVEGAYFPTEMLKVRKEGRVCRIPIMDAPVYTTWDLGLNDSMTITFWQDQGFERRAIDYYENSGEGFAHYAKVLAERGYNYSRHYMPHDADQRSLTDVAESRRTHAERSGIKPIEVLKRIETEQAGIDASRAYLASVWIDEVRCARLIQCLDNYRKAWDEKLGVFKSYPLHDEFSHGYKSFESAAIRPVPLAGRKIEYSQRGIV